MERLTKIISKNIEDLKNLEAELALHKEKCEAASEKEKELQQQLRSKDEMFNETLTKVSLDLILSIYKKA